MLAVALAPSVVSSVRADDIVGTNHDDILPGTNDNDRIWGLKGDDDIILDFNPLQRDTKKSNCEDF